MSTTFKPHRNSSVQVSQTQISGGEAVYVLHNPGAHTYVQIDAKNYFLWELMDGEHDLADLAMTYYSNYGALPFDRLDQLIPQLTENYLLAGTSPPAVQAVASTDLPRVKKFADTAFQREFVWHNADDFFTRFYQRLGWVFYKPTVLIVMGMIIVIGFACFIYMAWVQDYYLLKVNNSYGLGLFVLIFASLFVLFWHEAGHGLTCKSFGQHIGRAGMMFYYGRLAFFVDVSDMWMAQRGPRIWVSLAGPVVNALVGSLLAIITILLSSPMIAQVLYVGAFAAYLNAFSNLNPLLELDGYYALSDWLQISNLRRNSFAFVKKDLIRKMQKGERFSHAEIQYSVYGILGLAYTTLIVLLAIYLWMHGIQQMLQSLAKGDDILLIVLSGVLMIAAGTWLVVGLIARLVLWVRSKRQRQAKIPEGGGQEH